jgi:Restriction endonuclease
MGENLIENVIESYFPGAEISNTTKQAHQSDYHLKLDNYNLLIEVKTYQKNVPTKEVEKFFSDLQEHTNAQSGILISLSSGIAKRPKISYEWITDNKGESKLITFIPNAGTDGNGVIWGILFEIMVLGYLEKLNNSVVDSDIDVNKISDMVINQMQWVDHIINDMNISISEVQNSHQTIIKQIEKTNHLLVSKWNDNTKNLKKLIDSWRIFIEKGEFSFLPIITNCLSTSNQLICKNCSKKYKMESAYRKHIDKCIRNDTSTNSIRNDNSVKTIK